MHHDPWAISSEDEFDLTDCFAEDSVPATPYIQASPGWITEAKARMFIHGCKRPVNGVRAQAYRALRAPNTVEPHLGLDRSLGQVCIDDVRSLPIDRDEGQLPSHHPVSPTIPGSHPTPRHDLFNSGQQGPRGSSILACLVALALSVSWAVPRKH